MNIHLVHRPVGCIQTYSSSRFDPAIEELNEKLVQSDYMKDKSQMLQEELDESDIPTF